jgi:hypothetical protein
MVEEEQGQVVSTSVAPHPAVPESSGLLQVRCLKCTASRTIKAEPEVLAKYTNSLEPWDCTMGFFVDGEPTFGCDMTPTASGSSSTSASASMSIPNPHTGIEALTDQLKLYAQDQPSSYTNIRARAVGPTSEGAGCSTKTVSSATPSSCRG